MSKEASLREHIAELRSRLLVIVGVFIVWCGVGYAVREPLTKLILNPLGSSVYYSTPQGGFEFFMRVIMTAGFIAAVPIIVHQLLRFIEPAVGGKLTTKLMRRTLIWSLILAATGIVFAYIAILPTSLKFFNEFGGNDVQPLISADSYLNFVLGMLAIFALLFQLPLIVSIIDHIKPLKPQQLTKYRRHVFVGSLIIALIMPFTYDPITQFIIAMPIVVLFELSVLIVRWNHHLTRAEKKELRIAQLVEAMHKANQPAQQVQAEPVIATAQPEPEAEKVPEPVVADKQPEIVIEKPIKRVLVGPSKLTTKARPQVLDLRNAH